jgi:hypothetical protein
MRAFLKRNLGKKMNRKAENLDGIFMLFANFIVIGVAIVIGLMVFYSTSIDVRQEEAKTLSERLVSGMVSNGYFKDNFFAQNFDILGNADLNPKIMENGGNYYFNIKVNGQEYEKTLEYGTKSFEIQCSLPGKNLAKCYYKELIVLDKSGKSYELKILTASNQIGSRL